MYVKYHTEAIVLGGNVHGEADKMFSLYTRDFGLVRARASAVRREYSKMRFALQYYAHVYVSLVRGQSGWRAAGAQRSSHMLSGESLRAYARIAALTERLIRGEEKNEHLFTILRDVHDSLKEAVQPSAIELLGVARVLHQLGYLSVGTLEETLFTDTGYGVREFEAAAVHREWLLASINRALSETQL